MPILRDGGWIREAELRAALAGRPRPGQSGPELADLKAQLAANARGIAELERADRARGRDAVVRYMGHVQDNAEACVRRAVRPAGRRRLRYEMDDGSAIGVAVAVDQRAASAVRRLHRHVATAAMPTSTRRCAVCTAAVLYVFRTLVDDRHPAERRLPATARDPRAARLDAGPGAARRGRRRKRRDLTVHRGRALRRARRASPRPRAR